MRRTRVTHLGTLALILAVLSSSLLLVSGAFAAMRSSPTKNSRVELAYVTTSCGVVTQGGVQINSAANPCVVTVKVGTTIRVVFNTGWRWSNPKVNSNALQIRKITTSTNGVSGAVVVAMRAGTATMSSTGTLRCKTGVACSAIARLWMVHVSVQRVTAPVHTVTVTEAQRGHDFIIHVGSHFVLNLAGSSIYSWSSPASSNEAVLRIDSAALSSGNVHAVFSAITIGAARVTASENPNCYPQCLMPSRLFQVNVTVVH